MSRSYYICPKCGESVCVVKNNRRDADYWAKRLEQEGVPCESCREKEHDEEYEKAKKIEEELGLSPLAGTDRQIRWAACIRVKLMPIVVEAAKSFLGRDTSNAVLDYMRGVRWSSWWIDARHCTTPESCKHLVSDILTEIRRRSSVLSADLPEKLREELLVRPEHPTNDFIAEVSVKESLVSVRHPERDSIEQTMVANFFSWSSLDGEWKLEIKEDITGSAQERAANVIADLVIAGFIVGCMDSECIRRACAGEYTPMYPRWIRMDAKEKVGFVYLDEDFREQLERDVPCIDFNFKAQGIESRATCGTSLRTKYRNPSLPYDSILGFAEKYGFRITSDAMLIFDARRQRIEDAILLRSAPVERVKPQEKSEPEGVASELLDD